MKKLLVMVITMAVTFLGVSAGASAHDGEGGGNYPPQKPMVAPGRSVVGPRPTTVGIFATRFCPNEPIQIKLIRDGKTVIVKNTTTNAQGKATVYINTGKLKPGTYKITAYQASCSKYAQSFLTVRGRHGGSNDDDDRDDLGAFDSANAGAIGALTAGMEARAALLADRAPVAATGAALSTTGTSSDGVPVLQLTLVAGLCGAGLLAVNARRRRSLAVV